MIWTRCRCSTTSPIAVRSSWPRPEQGGGAGAPPPYVTTIPTPGEASSTLARIRVGAAAPAARGRILTTPAARDLERVV
jgi:hypothetical protein